MDKQEKYAVIVNESLPVSVIKDVVTFVMFAGLLAFNHHYLDGSTWVDVMFILFVLLFLMGRNSKSVFKGNIKDSIKWLESKNK